MIHTFICPNCQEIIKVEGENAVAICPKCEQEFDTNIGFKLYQNYFTKLVRSAEQCYGEAFNYELAFQYYGSALQLEENNLDIILGYLLSALKVSTLKKNNFALFIKTIDEKEIELGHDTYIRLGHFFEDSYEICFLYQKKVIALINDENSNNKKAIIIKDLLELLDVYNSIADYLSFFTEEELIDSFFLEKEVIDENITNLKNILQENNLIGDGKNYKETLLNVNGVDILYSEINVDEVSDVEDQKIFLTVNNMGTFKFSFVLLIILTIGIIAGFILMFFEQTKIAGYVVGPTCFALFLGVYYLNKVIRNKNLEKIKKS